MLEFLLAVILTTIMSILGYESGVENGRKEACASVHAEWVKDKCMKVTREEVK